MVDAKEDAVEFYKKLGFEAVNKEHKSDTTFMLKKVITPAELNSFEKEKRETYLHNLEELCSLFGLQNELEVIKKYYE